MRQLFLERCLASIAPSANVWRSFQLRQLGCQPGLPCWRRARNPFSFATARQNSSLVISQVFVLTTPPRHSGHSSTATCGPCSAIDATPTNNPSECGRRRIASIATTAFWTNGRAYVVQRVARCLRLVFSVVGFSSCSAGRRKVLAVWDWNWRLACRLMKRVSGVVS